MSKKIIYTSLLLACSLLLGCQRTNDNKQNENITFSNVDSVILLGIDFSLLTTISISRSYFPFEYNSMVERNSNTAHSCRLEGLMAERLLHILNHLEADTLSVQRYFDLVKKEEEYLLINNDPLDVRCCILLYYQNQQIPIYVDAFITCCNNRYYKTSNELKTFINAQLEFDHY